MGSVLAVYCCIINCHKLSSLEKQNKIYQFINSLLNVRSPAWHVTFSVESIIKLKSRCQPGYVPSEGSGEESTSKFIQDVGWVDPWGCRTGVPFSFWVVTRTYLGLQPLVVALRFLSHGLPPSSKPEENYSHIESLLHFVSLWLPLSLASPPIFKGPVWLDQAHQLISLS